MSGAKPFLDTNIFLYGFDRGDARKAKIAQNLIDELLLAENCVVSYQVVQEFVSVALKRFPAVMSDSELRAYLRAVFGRFEMVGSSLGLGEDALDLHNRYKLSWYDSLIVAAAMEAKCDVVYTEDLQHSQRFGDLVVTNSFL